MNAQFHTQEDRTMTTLPSSMRAVLQPAYGSPDLLELGALAVPTPGEGEVLVRVHATAVNKGDAHLMTGTPYLARLMGYGVRRPTIPVPGIALSGTVAALGPGVEAFELGDAVFGELFRGAWAEYAVVPADRLAPKPQALSFTEAAAVPYAANTALAALRDTAKLQAGERVLILGASGGVGSFAVQIAKAMGARVTAVCSASSVDAVRALGADEVIDYTQSDVLALGARFDVVVDFVGTHRPEALRVLMVQTGRLVAVGQKDSGAWIGPILWLLSLALADRRGPQTMTALAYEPSGQQFRDLTPWLERGEVRPLVSQTGGLDFAADALRQVMTGHTRGRLVLELVAD